MESAGVAAMKSAFMSASEKGKRRSFHGRALLLHDKLLGRVPVDLLYTLLLTPVASRNLELVASFAYRPNLLKYEEKTHACAASTPMERAGKTCGDHAHSRPTLRHRMPYIFLTAPLSYAAGGLHHHPREQRLHSLKLATSS